jgi:hypothetical protein
MEHVVSKALVGLGVFAFCRLLALKRGSGISANAYSGIDAGWI